MTLGIVALHALGAVPASVGLLALALLGATLGFAVFNKHPAQIFLGDAGSLPIGLMPRLHADRRGAQQSRRGAATCRSTRWPTRRSRCSAAWPRKSRSVGAPHAFLSARRDRRLERAASDDAHLFARAFCSPRSPSPRCWRIRLLVDLLCLGLGAAATALDALRPWQGTLDMTRRVLITGASGFIGKSLTEALAKEGWQVRAASRDPASIPAIGGVERVAMPDLAQPADWSALLDGVEPCRASRRHRARPGLAPRRAL